MLEEETYTLDVDGDDLVQSPHKFGKPPNNTFVLADSCLVRLHSDAGGVYVT